MKPKLRDYLTILMALVAIFLSGYGLGHLIGEKKGRKLAPSTIPLIQNSEDSTRPWEKRTLERLQKTLSLNAEQEAAVEKEIAFISTQINKSRNETLRKYFLSLLDLHDRIRPHLTSEQQKILKKDQENLRRSLK
ncbi:hypothetical protein OAF33_01610 [bacterium]|nr:hypothetical protein [Verrucomicrobiaceae bacterium]MDB4669721.1 hypothetical protein [bacterium]MDB4754300.1 hypothetical protein [Akkermansiaceae bacterium]